MTSRAPEHHDQRSKSSAVLTESSPTTTHRPVGLSHSMRHPDRGLGQGEPLRAISKRSLWSLQLFLLISCAAFLVRDFDLYATFPESVLQILGCAPPPLLVQIALGGYIFTVVTPLLIHMINGDPPALSGWHLAYRSIFYLFFLCSNTLTAHFVPVFAAGVSLYLLEQTCVGLGIYRLNHGDRQPA